MKGALLAVLVLCLVCLYSANASLAPSNKKGGAAKASKPKTTKPPKTPKPTKPTKSLSSRKQKTQPTAEPEEQTSRPRLVRTGGKLNVFSKDQKKNTGLAKIYKDIPAANVEPLHVIAMYMAQNAYKADPLEQLFPSEDGTADLKLSFMAKLCKPWKTIYASDSTDELVTKVIVNEQQKIAVVSQRGTKNGENVKADINFLKTPCLLNGVRYGEVHKGFLNTYNLNGQEVEQAISPYVKDGYRIIFTGHSMGGALATITALSVANNFKDENFVEKNKPLLITFASPKIGNNVFNAAVETFFDDSNHFRYVTKFSSMGTQSYDRVAIVGCVGCRHPKSTKLVLSCPASNLLSCHKMQSYIGGINKVSVLSTTDAGYESE